MDDWQEAAFTSRHVHNRMGRTAGRGAKRHAAFDARKALGTYSITTRGSGALKGARLSTAAAAATSKQQQQQQKAATASAASGLLEIYRFSDGGDGLVGEIQLAGALRAAVVLAGSRAALRGIIDGMQSALLLEDEAAPEEGEEEEVEEDEEVVVEKEEEEVVVEKKEEEEEGKGAASDEYDGIAASDASRSTEDEVDAEASQRRRYRAFEKNSFRAPKFWFEWRGQVLNADTQSSGLGYLVFSGNDCRKFQGTIFCVELGWENVGVTGRKEMSRAERDNAITWNLEHE
ncbi:hypothetical protein GGR56DRAFT_694834 [Xylariaceae sp. FL0804]|nr:hypothetical protein GGR56DRAFT_694834 [Xylariaceae sp. FL0804]